MTRHEVARLFRYRASAPQSGLQLKSSDQFYAKNYLSRYWVLAQVDLNRNSDQGCLLSYVSSTLPIDFIQFRLAPLRLLKARPSKTSTIARAGLSFLSACLVVYCVTSKCTQPRYLPKLPTNNVLCLSTYMLR